MKYTAYTPPADYAPPEPRKSKFLDLAENAIGLGMLFAGLVLFVVICHIAPDAAFINLFWRNP